RDSKKNAGDCLGSVESRYEFIQKLSSEHRLVDLCELLGVARSGYYAWSQGKPGKQAKMNAELSHVIVEIFAQNKGRYGSPRVTDALHQRGYACNHKRVERLMRDQGLRGRARKRWKPRTTDSRHAQPIAPNLLLERAAPEAPNEVWVEDITYL